MSNPSTNDSYNAVMLNSSALAKERPKSATNGNSEDADPNNGYLGDFYVEGGVLRKLHGYNWVVAAMFIIADMAGAGIVALPTSAMKASFGIGIALIISMAGLATVSAILLGKAWMIMLRMYPIYRTHCRRPYPEMGYRALGERMRTLVSGVMLVTQFGVSTTFLLIVAQTSSELIQSYGFHAHECVQIVVMALLLLPFIFQASPKDFWAVIVVATVSTVVAVVLIVIGSSLDAKCAAIASTPPFGLTRSVLAVGVFLFTYGGHAIFPTIQNDMRVPSDFSKSAVLAFVLVTITNVIVVSISGIVYGDSLRSEGVVFSIQTIGIQRAINFFITLHCFLTFPLMVNPMSQEIESYLGIPLDFDVRRLFFRTAMLSVIAFTALTIPKFDYFMGLIGGSLLVLTVMVLPSFFYVLLSVRERVYAEQNGGVAAEPIVKTVDSATFPEIDFSEVIKRTDKRLLIVCVFMFVIGMVACIVSTLTSMSQILQLGGNDLKPCYWSFFFDDVGNATTAEENNKLWLYNCCGHFQSVSLSGNADGCTPPRLEFYR